MKQVLYFCDVCEKQVKCSSDLCHVKIKMVMTESELFMCCECYNSLLDARGDKKSLYAFMRSIAHLVETKKKRRKK